jgi:hypothetical protein
MERHCNTLLHSVKSRRHPYASIASFVTATAQLNQIRLFYNLHNELLLDPKKRKTSNLSTICVRLTNVSMLVATYIQVDPEFMLSVPR